MRILLVEDDGRIAEFLSRGLIERGYTVDHASSAEDALDLVSEGIHDALIVDVVLPGMDGLEFIEQCRGRGVSAPVLILSARRTVDDRVRGLQRGGDDYLTKPFAFAELLARLEALLRRAAPQGSEPSRIGVADLEIDLLRHEARRGARTLALSHREFTLLEYLCRNAGRVVTRTMILDHVWQMRFDPATNVVDVHIHRLREKVDCNAEPKLIHTIRGVGYVLKS
ncbi:MAG TPA: response regulator transcription factor [Thermoanaerobaculaceae bacterium]|nr:MAG: DNA-binding response regulator [Acidobacteria bacterium 37-71-11]HQT93474.1 response regulator transcription factor [Thermoanaerobaculaceae bacterium]HQU33794.1 response regulator transcription factor [Thermoanaerobaculaceae bacterium]